MRPRRKAIVGKTGRTPTVRKVKPAIRAVSRRPTASRATGVPEHGPGSGGPGAATGPSTGSEPTRPGTDPSLDALGGHPVALEVDLGRGLVLPNPVIVASGPFGYAVELADLVDLARLGGIVTRGTSLKPRSGHPAPRTAEVPAGLLLGIGLQNPGLEIVIERYATTWARWTVPVILNLCGESAAELGEAARRLEGVAGIAGVEVNLSCPSGGRGGAFGLEPGSAGSAIGAVRRACDLPVIAKLTAAAADVRAVARAVEDAGADAISAINTLPGLAVAADRRGSALGSGYGGLCGPALKPIALRVVYEVAQAVRVPIIGVGGIASLDDVLDMLAVGAAAVEIGVAAMADPMLPVRLADELADACRARGIGAVADLTGTALPPRLSPPSTRGAEYAR